MLMKRTLTVFTIVVALMSTTAAAQDTCIPPLRVGAPPRGDLYAADAAALAAAWLPELERLYAGIPSLSPREEQWLNEEMKGGVDRFWRALQSREHALGEAKRDAGSLLSAVRHVFEVPDQAGQTRAWIMFAHTLIDTDSSWPLARLVAEKVIQPEVIPDEWTAWGGTMQDSIQAGRTLLARHVLICTLPAVLDFSMVD